MKRIFTLIAIFSWVALAAQEYSAPTARPFGRELQRNINISYSTAAEADAAAVTTAGSRVKSKFLQPIADWSSTSTDTRTTLSTDFTVPFAWANRQVLLHIESAASAFEVKVNGKVVGYSENGNVPSEFNLTKVSHEGRNKLEVTLIASATASAIESSIKRTEPKIDDAYIFSQPTIGVRDVLTTTTTTDGVVNGEVAIIVRCYSLNPKSARVYYQLSANDTTIVQEGYKEMSLSMRKEDTIRLTPRIPDSLVWTLSNPARYKLALKTQYEGRFSEFQSHRVAFRTADVRDGVMYINNTPTPLHVARITDTATSQSITALKREGYNTVIISGLRPSREIYEACDTIGMYVIAQAAVNSASAGTSRLVGGNPSNNIAWRETYRERATNTYNSSKHHPSVIAFSLGEKSANGICLYESYLTLKELESRRPIIYLDSEGEWNNDRLEMSFTPLK